VHCEITHPTRLEVPSSSSVSGVEEVRDNAQESFPSSESFPISEVSNSNSLIETKNTINPTSIVASVQWSASSSAAIISQDQSYLDVILSRPNSSQNRRIEAPQRSRPTFQISLEGQELNHRTSFEDTAEESETTEILSSSLPEIIRD